MEGAIAAETSLQQSRMRTRLCLQTPHGRLLGLRGRFFVGFASRIGLIRLGSAASIRSRIRDAGNPAEFSDTT